MRAGDDAHAVEAPRRRRATRRAFRPQRVVPAAVVAALSAVAAVLVLVEVVAALLRRPAVVLPIGWLGRLSRTVYWDDLLVLAGAAALAALGLVIVALALSPGRPRAYPLDGDDPEVLMGIEPAGLRRYAEYAARRVDGVTGARARIGRRRMRVRVTSPLHDTRGLPDAVRGAVERCFGELALRNPPRPRVSVRHREG
jgi:Family of unknown function (DUF6286)